jgi:hypothetical protein
MRSTPKFAWPRAGDGARAMNVKSFSGLYTRALTGLVTGLGIVSGITILAMIAVPVVDICLRLISLLINWVSGLVHSNVAVAWTVPGAYDLVKIAGIISLTAGLPYVTAVKGHVAIELVYHKLPKIGRSIVNVTVNLLSIAFFAVVCYQGFNYGLSLLASGEVSTTLQFPIFWIPFVLSFCSVIVVLVIFHVTLHPGKELIKP